MNFYKTAERVISEEATALNILKSQIPTDFSKVVEAILSLKGRLIILGIGKSGYIARKIAASLASTGTPAFYIHPAEASHGDLGMITKADMVFMLSNSGESRELFDTINYCKRFAIKIIAATMNPDSTLAKNSDFLLTIPTIKEASLLSAPTTSALMMLALGDAIIVSLHEAKGFSKDDFLTFHPGGKIGANLIKIKDLMLTGTAIPFINPDYSITRVAGIITEKKLGCAIVVDNNQTLIGIITDGDLRRNIDKDLKTLKAENLMTVSPIFVRSDILASEALSIMNNKSITILPVNDHDKVIGIIHIHDILKAGVA
ncbi:MAG: KpsF/GutQ family sugar-phosphate isomerase [Rickettsiaceae bacterium]|nr:KpsF/GutQ family sugar-phosphate isomerase [Rickettsiales bacterium]MCP5362751.1 KpsF/GutQ family sugar-phosphate isomerase [Rickettsiaceae bacterium]MCP5378391.1 KpsF/GutQ family sugar-phosphate isomerase [Rickettsiaceae bacterium]